MIANTNLLVFSAFGLGQTEMLIILFIVVFLFGAKRIPELGKSIGSGLRNFKKGIREEDEDEEEETVKALPSPEQKDVSPSLKQKDTQPKAS